MALNNIDHIVFVMLENRSFDHMVGYLSKGANPVPVDGLRTDQQWLAATANYGDSPTGMIPYPVVPLTDPRLKIPDPPHAYDAMEEQINTPADIPGPRKMGGFVSRYIRSRRKGEHDKTLPEFPGAVMGHFSADDVWMFDFFARQYCVCDRWFAPLPAGTHPNKLMALAGYSNIYLNATPLPGHRLVYDWLKNRAKWRCYVWDGMLPFVALIPEWWKEYLTAFGKPKHYQHYRKFAETWKSGDAASVIFIEPRYAEFGVDKANDDHSPVPIYRAQLMLEDIYNTLVSNQERWSRTLMIVTYDESGGFFDHVEPWAVPTVAGGKAFRTTGPRVPAFLVSPHVAAGVPFHEPVDHTAFLSLLGEKFGGGSYSDKVDSRQHWLGGRLADALLATPRTGEPPHPVRPPQIQFKAAAAEEAFAAGPVPQPDTVSAVAFDAAARRTALRFPEALEELSGVRHYVQQAGPPVLRHFDHIGDE